MAFPLQDFSSRVLILFAISFVSSFVLGADIEGVETCPPSDQFRKPFFFVVAADPQIGWNREGYNSEELFRLASEKILDLENPPEFVVVLGDLIQNPGNSEEYETTRSILDEMNVPYYVVAGNHDVGNVPTLERLDEFVDWWDLGEKGLWYTIEAGNSLIVMIDSNVLRNRDNPEAPKIVADLADEELDWLHEIMTAASNKYDHVLPFLHHPLAIQNLDEENRNENLPKTIRSELAGIFSNSGLEEYVFSGHFHKNARVVQEESSLEYVTYASTGVILGREPRDPSGLAVIQIFEERVEENYYGYEDFPTLVEADDAGFTVTNPVDGDVLEAGSVYCITWTSKSMAAHVSIEYSLGGGDWTEIISKTPNDGAHAWVVPDEPSDSVTVRVMVAYQNVVISGEIEGEFSIVTEQTPSITTIPSIQPIQRITNAPSIQPVERITNAPSIDPMQQPTGQPTAVSAATWLRRYHFVLLNAVCSLLLVISNVAPLM